MLRTFLSSAQSQHLLLTLLVLVRLSWVINRLRLIRLHLQELMWRSPTRNVALKILCRSVELQNGVTTLTNGEFTLGESHALAGSFSDRTHQGQVNISQGQIQDVLTALQFFELQDFSRGLQPHLQASELKTVPVGLPEAPLLTQLAVSEIQVLLQQQRQCRILSHRRLADLEGTFNGKFPWIVLTKWGSSGTLSWRVRTGNLVITMCFR